MIRGRGQNPLVVMRKLGKKSLPHHLLYTSEARALDQLLTTPPVTGRLGELI
jgi:hypothetical protein